LTFALVSFFDVLWRVVKKVVDLIGDNIYSALDQRRLPLSAGVSRGVLNRVDKPAGGQGVSQLAWFSGPLGSKFNIHAVTQVRVAAFVSHVPHTFEVSAHVWNRLLQ
jgi:hypothetical protein